MSETKLSAWQVLRDKFPAGEYVLIQEVSDASGHARSRSLDFMIINLWQSRGLAVTGIERKSNRGDWLKELKQPAKQENHFKYCDYFYLLTDKDGVAKLEEIPANWGWYHINKNGMLKTLKPAPKLSSIPIERSLMCAMLRRAASKDNYVHIDSIQEKIKIYAENIHQQRNSQLESEAKAYNHLKKMVDEFELASGIRISHAWGDNAKDMGNAVRLIMNGESLNHTAGLRRLEQNAKSIHEAIKKNLDELDALLPSLPKNIPA